MPGLLPTDILKEMSSMRRYARALTRDEHAADDVVQDAILKALEKRHTFRPDGSRRGWLLAIVHNTFVSTCRQGAARARRDSHFADILTDRVGSNQEHAACLHQVARAFTALPEHHREILHLVAVEGQSYREAAAILDISIGTVMSRLSRARAALRQLQGMGPDREGTSRTNRNRFKIIGGVDDD